MPIKPAGFVCPPGSFVETIWTRTSRPSSAFLPPRRASRRRLQGAGQSIRVLFESVHYGVKYLYVARRASVGSSERRDRRRLGAGARSRAPASVGSGRKPVADGAREAAPVAWDRREFAMFSRGAQCVTAAAAQTWPKFAASLASLFERQIHYFSL